MTAISPHTLDYKSIAASLETLTDQVLDYRQLNINAISQLFHDTVKHARKTKTDVRLFRQNYIQLLPSSVHITLTGNIYFDLKIYNNNIRIYLGCGSDKKAKHCFDVARGIKIARIVGENCPQTQKGLDAMKKLAGIGIAEIYDTIYFSDKKGVEKIAIFQPIYKYNLREALASFKIANGQKEEIAYQLTKAVAHINQSGIHGDLKPENILLDSNHGVAITDFDFYLDHHEESNKPRGTCTWTSPEYISHRRRDKLDAWALGAILYNMLYNQRLPFQNLKTALEVLRAIRYLPLNWQDQLSFTPKHRLEPIIRDLLQVDPDKRISAQTAVEMFEKIRDS
ncbi:MAG: hypothetical protein COT85_05340 [Chlamydiae bacterium CG10_big_fil_rev_8_21_14_0_10_42_34]|nr:MAG: hypothetical protein COT85_05340 [Chlamydiae bacterium CG10_big_fil_rev_8_21_14_0_10_42_34]